MRKDINKLIGLIAMSGHTEKDVYELASIICEVGPVEFSKHIGQVRKKLELTTKDSFDQLDVKFVNSPSSEVLSKIERLMLFEANLSKQEAIEMMVNDLAKRHPELRLPSESRKGFSVWIQKLATIIPEGELLHIATRIRNRYVHERPSDWQLR